MPVEVILPKVDMDMEEGSIQAWKVSEGDAVTAGQLIFEIGTNKAVMEVEAPASGTIRDIRVRQGDTVPVGTVVAWIYSPQEATAGAQPGTVPPASAQAPAPSVMAAPTLSLVSANDPGSRASATGRGIRATPLARRIARQKGIDLATVTGTGPRGRISERDVSASSAPAQSKTAPVSSAAQTATPAPQGELVPFNAIRKIVAKRLTESATTIPHFYVQVSMDMGSAIAFLKRVGPAIQAKTGIKPSMTAFLVHAVARVLVDHPYLNASVEGEAARLHSQRHIGVAMDRDGDLVVPVVRNAGSGAFVETVQAFDALRASVQSRSIKPSEMEGGTFTISNLGMFGVESFTAIINPPQTGILAVGGTVQTPCAIDGKVEIRPIAKLCLSADHRVVDGVAAAKFMADLKRIIETPELLV